jgi:acyl-CoA synthetase (AMP-forming)/AMP-acid ligase II
MTKALQERRRDRDLTPADYTEAERTTSMPPEGKPLEQKATEETKTADGTACLGALRRGGGCREFLLQTLYSLTMNIAERLRETAKQFPDQTAVACPWKQDRQGKRQYAQMTFAELEHESDRLARGLLQMGVLPGTRLVLLVRPGLEFVALTFALFKAGAVIVLIDPGMGPRHIFHCLDEVDPEGFVAVPMVQFVRWLKRRRFPHAKHNITVGTNWTRTKMTYQKLLGGEWTPFDIPPTKPTDPAAIIFTSGSTGPAKGVLYEHGMFNAQVDLIRDFYNIEPGGVDLSGFPLFALFNAAMGVTTVIPDMNPTRPAEADPKKILENLRDQNCTQAFGSPAIWNRMGRYCEAKKLKLPSTLKWVLSAGAPVPLAVLERMTKAFSHSDANMHTPYGATESLPVASFSSREILAETAPLSRQGAGTCVGRIIPGVTVKIIEITEGPIASLGNVKELPHGEIGEIIVQSASTTREYFRRAEPTRLAKIPDGDSFWHRMGDVGYLDHDGKLWFCGRKAHVVETKTGRLYSVCCEAIFNEHPLVFRSALVGVGPKSHQTPVIIIELEAGHSFPSDIEEMEFYMELEEMAATHGITQGIKEFLYHPSLPVDIRHNVKINREQLAAWATEQRPDL